MEELTTIPKLFKPAASQNYDLLRSEGLKHIENLASDLWNDYNAHDPGITILEALCYAITELGYRCNFDMTDLLRTEQGDIVTGQTLFTAKDILTVNPLSKNDYRKLLIDIEGVHNGWMVADDSRLDEAGNSHAINEVELFADCENDRLSLIPNLNPVCVSGLYRVLLDLDWDDRFGNLNNGQVSINNPASPRFIEGEFLFQFNLKSWKSDLFGLAAFASVPANITSFAITEVDNGYQFTLLLTDGRTLAFTVDIPLKPSSGKVALADVQYMFDTSRTGVKETAAVVFQTYLNKITKAKTIVDTAARSLLARRNLCEDFIEVTTIEDVEIAFCFDVDVNPDADIEKVQAAVFYAIENYLNPSVEFYSLKELLDKKIPVDEIFTGPALQHGFIDTAQLEQTNLRQIIHASDVINLLMDIEGVQAIRNFMMTRYNADGKADPENIAKKWCLNVTPLHKPILSTSKSKILLFKNQFPFLANYAEVRDTVLVLHATRAQNKMNGLAQDLALPKGNKRDTESFWPLQYDFPQTYGIGEFGLPAGSSPLRIAEQLQLKAYLMFYEQLLADFFSQLSNAHQLFSVNDIKQTYFARFLDGIKDVDPIYSSTAPFTSLRDLLLNQDATTDLKNGWQSLYETKSVYEDRRNRFLDHLLSRFGESFNDYALLMYRINYEERTEEKISFTETSAAKINTLKSYPSLSSGRGMGYNYFPQKPDLTIDQSRLWDTDNVSGLEKRISFLTGIKDYTRRFLYCIKQIEIVCNEEEIVTDAGTVIRCFHSFTITTLSGLTMHSVIKYDTEDLARQAVDRVIILGADVNNYFFSSRKMAIKDGSRILVSSDKTYANRDAMDADALEFSASFANGCNAPIGMHLIEHILLRPRDAGFNLMQVCLDECDCVCEWDPYTFRASVVLPYWPGHFDHLSFRKYFEEKMREEAPAHVMLKICWLSNELMRRFEVCYKAWVEQLAAYTLDKVANRDGFKTANDAMIALLAELHSEYPKATLHNCDESKESSNTVTLGKTVLGTFKRN